MIDKNVVTYIAGLARLAVSEEETVSFERQLGAILSYVEQLDILDTSGVDPTSFIAPAHDPLRDDIPAQSLPSETLLANGPKVVKGHFAVPKIIQQ